MKLENLKNRILPVVTMALVLLLLALLVLSPADTRLGNIVKLAYLHGALNWAGLFTFSAAGVLWSSWPCFSGALDGIVVRRRRDRQPSLCGLCTSFPPYLSPG